MEYKASPIQSNITVLVLAGIRIYDYLPSSSGSGHDGKWHESRAVIWAAAFTEASSWVGLALFPLLRNNMKSPPALHAQVSSWDRSDVHKLPHSIPKGEYLSHVFSTIVILKRRSERQDSMKKCMVSQLARSNNEDISSFSLKGGTNLSALSRSKPEKSIRSLLDPIELTYECIHRERSIYPWQR